MRSRKSKIEWTAGKVITGSLHGFWEQGMEGRIEYTLEPDNPADRIDGQWPIRIKNGQFLKIFGGDGRILWQGEINYVSRRHWLFFYEKHDLPNGIWHDSKQKGLTYGQWIAWFWQKPPLRAELMLPPGA